MSIDKVSRNIFRFHRIVVLQDQIIRPLLWDDHYCFLQRFKVLAEFDWMWKPLNLFLPTFSFRLCMGRCIRLLLSRRELFFALMIRSHRLLMRDIVTFHAAGPRDSVAGGSHPAWHCFYRASIFHKDSIVTFALSLRISQVYLDPVEE